MKNEWIPVYISTTYIRLNAVNGESWIFEPRFDALFVGIIFNVNSDFIQNFRREKSENGASRFASSRPSNDNDIVASSNNLQM